MYAAWRRSGFSADVVAELACCLPRLTFLELHDLVAEGDTALAPLSRLSGLRRLAFRHKGAALGALAGVPPLLTALKVGGRIYADANTDGRAHVQSTHGAAVRYKSPRPPPLHITGGYAPMQLVR